MLCDLFKEVAIIFMVSKSMTSKLSWKIVILNRSSTRFRKVSIEKESSSPEEKRGSPGEISGFLEILFKISISCLSVLVIKLHSVMIDIVSACIFSKYL